jgi:hypothetical protein
MKFLSHQLRAIITTIGLSLIYSPSQAMIVASSCLKRFVPRHNKLIVLYDKHAFHPDEAKSTHVNDMKKFINELTKNKHHIPFLVEIGESHQDSTRLSNMVESPSNVAIRLALENKMKYKNINFIPFDIRKHPDTWMRDMLWQTDQFAQALKQNYPFPPQFHSLTSDHFLEHLDDRYHSTQETIENLPVSSTIKKEYYDTNKQKYTDAHLLLNSLLKKYNIKNNQHLFNLITRLNDSEKTRLFLNLTEENNYALDTNLLSTILQKSNDHPLSVLLAGAYHSNNIEKYLVKEFAFEKDPLSSMTLPDLKVNDLTHIQWPKNVPDNFMNKNMELFVSGYTNE